MGNDIYQIESGTGHDYILDEDTTIGNFDILEFSAEITSDDVVVSEGIFGDINLTFNGGADVISILNGINDSQIELVRFNDGTEWDATELLNRIQQATATQFADEILASTIGGVIDGMTGNDILGGNIGNDILIGGAGDDWLLGKGGIDILIGADGSDELSSEDKAALFGGVGNDYFWSNADSNLLIGGIGTDEFYLSGESNVISFNRGDGKDFISSGDADNTLSIGHGISYSDLSFLKSDNNLVLSMGENEQITFADWYGYDEEHSNKSITNLQIIIEETGDYNSASTNSMSNKKIQLFDFDGLVRKFDQARSNNPRGYG